MPFKVAYIHNVCMYYRVPLLSKIAKQPDICLKGFFGQTHRRSSKRRTVKNITGFQQAILPTLSMIMPYKGRKLHIFWNPTLLMELYRFRPDIIVAGNSNFPNNFFVALYARFFGIPYIWHGIGSMYEHDTLLRRFFRYPLRWFFSNSNAGIAFNMMAKEYFVRAFGYPSERIFVAPNVVDTEKIGSEKRKFASQVDAKRRELGLGGMKTVLFVGNLEPAKRVDRLLRAFAQIHPKVPNTVLLLVGDGSARSQLEKLSVELGLDRVIFAGQHIADANLYFMLGDIFVLPGLGGLAISQAMSHGLPVISGKADGTELDLIINDQNGYILSNNTDPVEQIRQKLLILLLDDHLRMRMGKQSSQLINERFNINNTASIFVEAVKTCCE